MIAIQLYSGFLQPEQISNGLEELRNRIIVALGDKQRVFNYSTWTDSPKLRADNIRRANPTSVYIAGHSYGGSTAVMLAECLAPLKIDGLFLLDAIHRSGCGTQAERVLPHRRNIQIPNNVKKVWAWKQNKFPPRGSGLKISYPTLFKMYEVVQERHSQMDELPAFHYEFMREIYRVIQNG